MPFQMSGTKLPVKIFQSSECLFCGTNHPNVKAFGDYMKKKCLMNIWTAGTVFLLPTKQLILRFILSYCTFSWDLRWGQKIWKSWLHVILRLQRDQQKYDLSADMQELSWNFWLNKLSANCKHHAFSACAFLYVYSCKLKNSLYSETKSQPQNHNPQVFRCTTLKN